MFGRYVRHIRYANRRRDWRTWPPFARAMPEVCIFSAEWMRKELEDGFVDHVEQARTLE